jgi:hypothetical protein
MTDKKHGWLLEKEEGFHGFVLYDRGEERYYIDLDRCNTSAAVLDWIFQLWGKTWVRQRPEVLVGLIKIMQDTIRPQATLCSDGKECGPINWDNELPRLTNMKEAVDELAKNHQPLNAEAEE